MKNISNSENIVL